MAAAYEKGDRVFCGLKLPEGLDPQENMNCVCVNTLNVYVCVVYKFRHIHSQIYAYTYTI